MLTVAELIEQLSALPEEARGLPVVMESRSETSGRLTIEQYPMDESKDFNVRHDVVAIPFSKSMGGVTRIVIGAGM